MKQNENEWRRMEVKIRPADDAENIIKSEIWNDLQGKRIVLAGVRSGEYELFLENLARIAARPEPLFCVQEGVETVQEGDLVILFAGPQAGGEWIQELNVLEQLASLAKARTGAVLLVSTSAVYGKSFGCPHLLRENDIGYVGHAERGDLAAQCLRTAEHFAYRFAQENNVPVKIARMGMQDGGAASAGISGAPGSVRTDILMEAAVKVLLYGAPGEAYNLPDGVGCEAQEVRGAGGQTHSPLQPIPVRMDTEKLETLGR